MDKHKEPSSFVISVTGGTGAGKTSLVKAICSAYPEVSVLDQDSYYIDHTVLSANEKDRLNFDHPSAIDHDLLFHHLCELLNGNAVEKPSYSFVSHSRQGDAEVVKAGPLIVVEGILALWDPRVRELTNLKVYVDVDPDVRFIRRLRRDLLERGRTVDSIVRQYLDSVRPMHQAFIEPLKVHADVVIDGAEPLSKALTSICDAITTRVQSVVSNPAPRSPQDKVRLAHVVPQMDPDLRRTDRGRNNDYLSSTLDWNLLTAGIRKSVQATAAAVFVLKNGELVCRARSGRTAPELGARVSAQAGPLSEFVHDGIVLSTDPKPRTECALYCPGARSSIAIPLFQGINIVGVFEVFSDEKNAFSCDAIKSLGIFADVIREVMDNRAPMSVLPEGDPPLQSANFAAVDTAVLQRNAGGKGDLPQTYLTADKHAVPTWEQLCEQIIADYENSPEAQSDLVRQLELEAASKNTVSNDQPHLS